jgi:hypothetical protein
MGLWLGEKTHLTWFSKKYFSFILDRIHILEVAKNSKTSCYIISNLIFNILIAIYFI